VSSHGWWSNMTNPYWQGWEDFLVQTMINRTISE
jgi:hypothetical protein